MPLHLAVNIVIIDLLQVIGKPFVLDCQQSEESGLSRTLPTNKAEHDFKFASWLEHSADSSQHEQSQARISVLVVLRTEETGQSMADALCAVPFQTVQIVANGVIPVAVSNNGNISPKI